MTDIASAGGQGTDSLNGRLTFEQDKNRIIGRDEDNLPRLLIFADGIDFVMKISKEGIDVLTATDDELIFNSSQNIPKIGESGVATLSAALNQGTFNSVPHPLGITPMVIATAVSPNFPANRAVMLPWSEDSWSAADHVIAQISNVTDTDIQFEVNLGSTPTGHVGDWTFKYLLLQESAI